jgi:hypothetical protein
LKAKATSKSFELTRNICHNVSSSQPVKRSSLPANDFDGKLYVARLVSDVSEEASVAVLECNSKVEPENCFDVAALLAERVRAKRYV